MSASEAEGESSLRARTLDAVVRATSAMLNPDSWDEPFSPAIQTTRSRAVVPSDLDADELTLLAEALPLRAGGAACAPLADVVWTYRFPRNPAVAFIATDAKRGCARARTASAEWWN